VGSGDAGVRYCGPGELLALGVGVTSGGGVALGEVLGRGGATSTPGPRGITGNGTCKGVAVGEGEGEAPVSSSSSPPGDGLALGALVALVFAWATWQGRSKSASARAWAASGAAVTGRSALAGAMVPAISTIAIADARNARIRRLL
jgi:hypothetical protein